MDYTAYVHEYEGRWIVAWYDDQSGVYYAVLRPENQRATGCSQVYGSLSYVASEWNYKHRRDALRRARLLYGEEGE